MKTIRTHWSHKLGITLLTALLISCGGGGSNPVRPDPVEPTNPATPDTPDATTPGLLLAQSNISQVKAPSFWAEGYDGSGVTVAVIDTGLLSTHEAFAGRVVQGYNVADNSYDTSDAEDHGTHVAGIIAGAPAALTDSTIGVAPGASIMPIRVVNSAGQATTTDLQAALNYARNRGVKLANLSMDAPIGDGSYTDYTRTAITNYTNAGGLLVVAAGNNGLANPTGIGQYADDWTGSVMVVGAVDSSNNIASYSNRAGNEMNYYLVAPGTYINSAYSGGDDLYTHMTGTSMATPHVTGAAALIWDRWPSLTARQVSSILFESATDLGAAGVDAIYGHGLLNLSAAMSPLGVTSIPADTSVDGSGTTLSDTQMVTSAAFGDALTQALAGSSVLAIDSYDRDFYVNLASAVTVRNATVDLEDRLAAMTYGSDSRDYRLGSYHFRATFAGDRGDEDALSLGDSGVVAESLSLNAESGSLSYGLGFTAEPGRTLGLREQGPLAGFDAIGRDTFGNPYLGLMEHARYAQAALRLGRDVTVQTRLVSGRERSDLDRADSRATATLVEGSWRATPRLTLGFQAGQTQESDAFLGTESGGALALGSATRTDSVGITGLYQVSDRMALFGHYTRGRSRVDGDASGVLRNISGVQSESYGVGLVMNQVFNRNDRLGVAWTRPLRVVDGKADADMPVSLADDGSVVRSTASLDLTPSGNEQDVELFYRWQVNDHSHLAASVLHQREPGHVADAPSDTSVLLSYGLKW